MDIKLFLHVARVLTIYSHIRIFHTSVPLFLFLISKVVLFLVSKVVHNRSWKLKRNILYVYLCSEDVLLLDICAYGRMFHHSNESSHWKVMSLSRIMLWRRLINYYIIDMLLILYTCNVLSKTRTLNICIKKFTAYTHVWL